MKYPFPHHDFGPVDVAIIRVFSWFIHIDTRNKYLPDNFPKGER